MPGNALARIQQLVTFWQGPIITFSTLPKRVSEAKKFVEEKLGYYNYFVPPFDLGETLSIIRDHWDRDFSLESIAVRHLRRTPHVLFYGPKPHLADDNTFMGAYLNWLGEQPRTSTILPLLYVFLKNYPVDSPSFNLIRERLDSLLERASSLKAKTWQRRCADYGLLKSDGARSFAELMIQRDDWSIEEILIDAGLTGGLSSGEFLMTVYNDLLELTNKKLVHHQLVENIWNRIKSFGLDKNQLRFETGRARLAEAILEPFVNGSVPSDLREHFKTFFRKYYGHPHINPGHWMQVSESSKMVFLRWLSEEAIEDFIAILDATALERHWRYRRAFWRAYLDYIDCAWVVLASEARYWAKARLPERAGSYANLTGAYDTSQSVLLLQIQGLTIAEWSHNGSCRIWLPDNKNAPKMYKETYDRWDLTFSPDGETPHTWSETGSWQHKVETFIRDYTGITVSRRDYMPTE